MKKFVRDYKSERIIKSISAEKKTALIEAEKEYKKSLNEISSIHMKKCKRILIISIILWIAFLLGVLILLLNYNILCAFIWFILLSIYCDAYIYKRADNLVGGIHENFVELIFKIPIAKTEKIVKALEEKYRENIKEINKKYKNIVESAIKEELEAYKSEVIDEYRKCKKSQQICSYEGSEWIEKRGDWVVDKHSLTLLSYDGNEESVVIPDYITSIYFFAAYNDNIKEVTFMPESACIGIGKNAFQNCGGLKKVEFPDSIYRIEDCAFNGCRSLEDIRFGKHIPELSGLSFFDSEYNIKIYISPEGINPHKGCFSDLVHLKRTDCWKIILDANSQISNSYNFIIENSFFKLVREILYDYNISGELAYNADYEKKYEVLSKYKGYHHLINKEIDSTDARRDNYKNYKGKRIWYHYSNDHFKCELVYLIFYNFILKEHYIRAKSIAFLLREGDNLTAEEINDLQKYRETTGYQFEVFKAIGREEKAHDENYETAKEYCSREENKGVRFCKDCYQDEVGIIYLELLSGKKYIMKSDWYVGTYDEEHYHDIEEIISIDYKHYLEEYIE